MRTRKLSRWLISGALVAAGVVAGFGGQTAGSGMGDKALAVETAHNDSTEETVADVAEAPEQTGEQGDPATNDGYDWT